MLIATRAHLANNPMYVPANPLAFFVLRIVSYHL
jgi:hypothetical protein